MSADTAGEVGGARGACTLGQKWKLPAAHVLCRQRQDRVGLSTSTGAWDMNSCKCRSPKPGKGRADQAGDSGSGQEAGIIIARSQSSSYSSRIQRFLECESQWEPRVRSRPSLRTCGAPTAESECTRSRQIGDVVDTGARHKHCGMESRPGWGVITANSRARTVAAGES